MDLILGGDKQINTPLQEHVREDDDAKNDLQLPTKDNFLSLDYEAPSPAFSKHDTGEVLFPKFLDNHEVDSIVSLERTRSTKSNKRSSMNSQRRSLTDTLSIKAQSEGMFITEASSVILSTPDLTKSPASSILKNGRFEYSDNFSREHSYEGTTNEDFLDIKDDSGPLKKDDIFLESIEQKFDQLVMASDEEKTEVERDVPKPREEPLKKDSERQSTWEIQRPHMQQKPPEPVGNDEVNRSGTFDTRNNKEDSYKEKETQSYSAAGATTYGDERQGQLHTFEQDGSEINDNEFENEDFNKHIEQPIEVTPRNNAYLPEFEPNRPVSMSFKGLKAPRMNTSFIDSMTPDSPVKSDLTSLGEVYVNSNNDQGVRFSSQIILYDTYGEFEYDRHPEISTCNQLTPQLAQMIKLELNELKSAMEVHDDSRCYTHFY
ncbi:AEL_collapsed_G0046040.mRNA.1.CDS.1 [Saccharomyces cerevisiae]|nr:AEL_collapsed_G0046040.mRNA.1.CDS.1 [Saccharomyces cerevisiae]